MKFFINSKFRATNADTLENIHNHREKLDIIDWAGKSIMAKVAGTGVIGLATSAAHFAII
jgi:hypothetical protein